MPDVILKGFKLGISNTYTPPISTQVLGEFYGPFPSWNILDPIDGDITTVLQTALDNVGTALNPCVVYLKNGNYTISSTINITNRIGISFLGESTEGVKITWLGAEDGRMFDINGVAYSRFGRMTINGNNLNTCLWEQSLEAINIGYPFDTGNIYHDMIFEDGRYGIHGGFRGWGFAETAIQRCKFLNLTGTQGNGGQTAGGGIQLGNFNALDCWIWDCYFENNTECMTNSGGAGGLKVYRSIAVDSGVFVRIAATEGFAIRENWIKNCYSLFYAGYSENSCQIICQDNTILDCWDYPYNLVNQGPCLIQGDTIRTPLGQYSEALIGLNGAEYTVIDAKSNSGNWYQVNNLYNVDYVTRASLESLDLPAFVGFQPAYTGTKFEVPVQSTVAQIQAIIDQAALLDGQKPIVHIPRGSYNINTTLNITTDVRLVGDGHDDNSTGTALVWTGAADGYVISIDGRKKALPEGIFINAQNIGNGILIHNADQTGGQVLANQLELRRCIDTMIYSDRLDKTNVIITNAGFAYDGQAGTGIKVKGGTITNSGTVEGRTILYATNGAADGLQLDVQEGGNLVIKDGWKEVNHAQHQFLGLNANSKGSITIDGARINAPFPKNPSDLTIEDFNGKVVILGAKIDNKIDVKGDGTNTKLLVMSSFMNEYPYLNNTSSPMGDARLLYNRQVNYGNNSSDLPDIGTASASYLEEMLIDSKEVKVPKQIETQANITNVNIVRVWITNAKNGLHIKPD